MAARVGTAQAARTLPECRPGSWRCWHVPEQLLDRAQVRAAIEQVGGERVTQRVRRARPGDADAAAPDAQAPAHVARRQPPTRLAQEQRRLSRRPSRQRRARRAPGSASPRPARARRRARSGSSRPCPRRGPARRRSRSPTPSARRAPRRAGRTRRPARTARGRAARAALDAGNAVEQPRHLVGLEHARQPARGAWARSAARPGSGRCARARADRQRTTRSEASLRAVVLGARRCADSSAT